MKEIIIAILTFIISLLSEPATAPEVIPEPAVKGEPVIVEKVTETVTLDPQIIVDFANEELEKSVVVDGKEYIEELNAIDFYGEKIDPEDWSVPFIHWAYVQAYGEDAAKAILPLKFNAEELLEACKGNNTFTTENCTEGDIVFLKGEDGIIADIVVFSEKPAPGNVDFFTCIGRGYKRSNPVMDPTTLVVREGIGKDWQCVIGYAHVDYTVEIEK